MANPVGPVYYKLLDSFRFLHEPYDALALQSPPALAGRDDQIDALVGRILLSDGGAILIAGYRGVGKTSYVNSVIARLRANMAHRDPNCTVLHVYLPLSRELEPVELMQHVLWGLHEQLTAHTLIQLLDRSVEKRLEVAYLRTSLNIAMRTSDQRERGIQLSGLGKILGLADVLAPISLSSKTTRTTANDYAYANYDEKAIEHDIIRITRELSRGFWSRRSRLGRILGRPRKHLPIKIVFTFDELDKLETDDSSAASNTGIDGLLRNLKTLLTTSRVTFLFVGGKGLYERWLSDVNRGDSVYESVFAHAIYLPALWHESETIADTHLQIDQTALRETGDSTDLTVFSDFKGFVAFTGRGIPRRIVRTLQSYVLSDREGTYLRFLASDARQFRFYSDLEQLLQRSRKSLYGESAAEMDPERQDRQQLGLYYLIDWALSHGAASFTFGDAVAGSAALSRQVAMAEDVVPLVVRRLLDILVAGEFLAIEETVSLSVPVIKGRLVPPDTRFRVPRKRLIEMGRYEALSSEEPDQPSSIPWPEGTSPGVPPTRRKFADRYELISELGRGGFSTVYRAFDIDTARVVALKLLNGLLPDTAGVARFQQEVTILAGLNHPGVVRCLGGGISDSTPYLALDLIEGISLAELVDSNSPLPWQAVVEIGRMLFVILEYLHNHSVLWRDGKPQNVLVTEQGELVVLDFGVSLIMEGTSATGIIGTPGYMAPEVITGDTYNVQADIYSVGILMFELVTGRLPFASSSTNEGPLAMIYRIVNEDMPSPQIFVDVPPKFEDFITAATLKNPAERLPSARAALDLLDEMKQKVDLGRLASNAHVRCREQTVDEARNTMRASAVAPASVDLRDRTNLPLGSGRAEDPVSDVGPYILVGLAEKTLTKFRLKAPVMRVGRSRENDIVLDDDTVSRYHLTLRDIDGVWWAIDGNSANGFTTNGIFARRFALNNGDDIRVGSYQLIMAGLENDPIRSPHLGGDALALGDSDRDQRSWAPDQR